ncbi:hypothetical protein [Nonomuraea basaltis]|uniref:hypothetical protein n=1 Tax=Nonomuraea basaltis TaxID=2495887 RepID=UPI0014864B93|nr:hypothetical protein [Nonomuraea basaltis]
MLDDGGIAVTTFKVADPADGQEYSIGAGRLIEGSAMEAWQMIKSFVIVRT